MKILHVIAGIDRRAGGPTYALLNILKAERALGYYNEVVSVTTNNMETQILEEFKVHLFPYSFPRRFARSRAANSWIKQNTKRFDVVHIHGIWSFLCLDCARICLKSEVRYIFRGHGALDPFDLRKKYWLKEIIGRTYYRRLFNNASAFFCTAGPEADYLETYGAKTSRFVVPLAVDYDGERGNRHAFREKYGIKENEFVFLFLSRIDYKKGLDLLIPAFHEILSEFQNVRLVIAGSETKGYEKKIKKLVSKYRLSNRVIFTGLLKGEAKADAFAGSDVFVLPSQNENFGIAVVESLQSGLPVLISNNVYIHDQISRLKGGWVCRYSLQSLTDHMRHILTDQKDYQVKKANAVVAGEFYLARNVVNLYKEFYEAVVN